MFPYPYFLSRPHTRATLKHSTSPPRPTGLGNLLKLLRDGDRLLQLLIFNEEFLVSACHQRALITSLPFVHTARRSYRLNDPVRPPDWGDAFGSPDATLREAVQTLLFRGRRSRNKVSVGEPAEGSLPVSIPNPVRTGGPLSLPPRWEGRGFTAAVWGASTPPWPLRAPRRRRRGPLSSLLKREGRGAVGEACVGMRPSVRARVVSGVCVRSRRLSASLPPAAPSHPNLASVGSGASFVLRARGSASAGGYTNKPNNNSCRRISWLPQR